jgi:hypothetical protein
LKLNRLGRRRDDGCTFYWGWGLAICFGAFVAGVLLSRYTGAWVFLLMIPGILPLIFAQLIDCPRCGKSLRAYSAGRQCADWPKKLAECGLFGMRFGPEAGT